MNAKFHELTMLEGSRINQGRMNPNADSRWIRLSNPRTRLLDRYMNIQPWNYNRVKLRVPSGHADYINASPIVLDPVERATPESREEKSSSAVGQESYRYIAMQGPKPQSTHHVWRMVVEQLESSGVIVMLTETHEAGQEKCWPYFPSSTNDPPLEINEHDEFGDGFRATVRCEAMEETEAGDAIELRKLVIRVHRNTEPTARKGFEIEESSVENGDTEERRGGATTPERKPKHVAELMIASPTAEIREGVARVTGISGVDAASSSGTGDATESSSTTKESPNAPAWEEEDRVVWHFLYKKWPDFGVPLLDDLESFFTLMRLSQEKNAGSQSPRIVHCSAGVGRSGTFIALEHLMRALNAGAMEGGDSATSSATRRDRDEDDEDDDLIYSTVSRLREQRGTMVQAQTQYRFLYHVMRKLWLDKYGEDDVGEPAAKRLEVDPFVED